MELKEATTPVATIALVIETPAGQNQLWWSAELLAPILPGIPGSVPTPVGTCLKDEPARCEMLVPF